MAKELLLGLEHTDIHARRKKRKLTQLSLDERVLITKKAMSKRLTHLEIAELYNVSVGIVVRLVFTMKHN